MAALSAPLSNPNPNSSFFPPIEQEQEEEENSAITSEQADRSEPDYEAEPETEPASESEPEPASDAPIVPAPPPAEAAELLHLSFNQDHGCFAAGTGDGFRIFNCDPFREIFRRDFGDAGGGGIGVVAMLFRCNILVLVGGGPRPHYSPNKVMIWDDHQSRCIGELSFRSEVRSVRLRRDRIVVVLDHKIFVYNFADLKLVHQIETVPNPRGLCEVSQQQGALVLVCPGGQKGQVRVEHYGTKKTKFIMAHDSRLACFTLSQDGKMIATASTKGTLIRVFGTADGTLLQEVRRGADRAEIFSLAFSENMQWLAVSSDKGTVHVFSLKINLGLTANDKPRPAPESNVPAGSSLSFIKGVLPKYFHSEWSVAQFRLHEGSQCIVAFGHKKNTIVILGMDGRYIRSYNSQYIPTIMETYIAACFKCILVYTRVAICDKDLSYAFFRYKL